MPMHIVLPLDNKLEYIATEITPYVSKVQVRVCYVGQTPNRNHTVITKEVATEMGNKLPGCPIVGYYNEQDGDFEEHNRIIELTGGSYRVVDTTKPYGFVAPDAKVWFQKFTDDGVEHEYLCTEGYIWTGVYPESKRITEQGNNHSMELHDESIRGTWSKDLNSGNDIFIYSEALIEKLCVLGEDFEPCFEGAQFKTEFSLQLNQEMEQLKTQMFALMNEVKEALKEGGQKVNFTKFIVEIGDGLWSALYRYLEANYSREGQQGYSRYNIRGIYEEGTQKFAILADENSKLFRMNFSYTEAGLSQTGNLQEVAVSYVPVEQFSFTAEDYENYKKKQEEEDEKKQSGSGDSEDNKGSEGEEEDDDKKKKKYSLNEIPEYVELQNKFAELESKFSAIQESATALATEVESLRNFKSDTELEKKKQMIDSFFMLSAEDKKDCLDNINTYSVDDIEAKLSVICYRKKVSFVNPEDDDNGQQKAGITTFSCNQPEDNSGAPAWIKAVLDVQNKEE